jgi:hypothetical protein
VLEKLGPYCYGSPFCEPNERCDCLNYFTENPEELGFPEYKDKLGRWAVMGEKSVYLPTGAMKSVQEVYAQAYPGVLFITSEEYLGVKQ